MKTIRFGVSMIRRPHHVALGDAGGVEHALELEAGDHVGIPAVAVGPQLAGVELLETDRDEDRAGVDLDLLRPHVEVDGVDVAGLGAVVADEDVGHVVRIHLLLVLGDLGDAFLLSLGEVAHEVQAGFAVDHIGRRNRLREGPVDGLARLQTHVELVAADLRAGVDAQAAGHALVLRDVTRMLAHLDPEVARFPFAADDLGVGDDLDERMPTGIHGLRPENSYSAVHGGKGLVELGHSPAQ